MKIKEIIKTANTKICGFLNIEEYLVKMDTDQGEVERTSVNVNRGESVAVLVYNTDTNTYLFTKQFRLPVWTNNKDGFFLEIPAGKVDAGESPVEAVRRELLEELLEELGYEVQKADDLQFVVSVYPSPGACSEIIHIYRAVVNNNCRVAEGGGKIEENEYIETVALTANEVGDEFGGFKIVDAKTIIALTFRV